mgnify:CR=1 FL=1
MPIYITTNRGVKSIAESEARKKWFAENTVCVNLRINRNQDPELYELLTKADNKSAIIREVMQKAMEEK